MKHVLYEALDGCTYSAPVMNVPFLEIDDYPEDNWGTGIDLKRVWVTAVEDPRISPLVLLEIVSRWDAGSGRTVGKRFLEASPSDIARAGRLAGYDPDDNPLVGYVKKRAS